MGRQLRSNGCSRFGQLALHRRDDFTSLLSMEPEISLALLETLGRRLRRRLDVRPRRVSTPEAWQFAKSGL
jgi:CRP-like cAMP-binding protein